MDIYLPNEFYELRAELRDWRDASSCDRVLERTSSLLLPDRRAMETDACADPGWRVF
jgi:hypothetical protein